MQVVMCTAHDEFALRAIRYQVVDYILKPLEIQDLIATIDKIEKKLNNSEGKQVFDASVITQYDALSGVKHQRVAISEKKIIDFISLEDVLCVETHKGVKKCEVVLKHHAKGEFLLVNQGIFDMEKNF